MRRIVCTLLLVASVAILCISHTAASAPPAVYPFQNRSLSVDDRMDNLLSLLTLEEKQSRLYDGRAFMPGIARLNVSVFEWGQECLRGLINRLSDGNVSNFPQSLGLAASWNTSVFSSMGDVISNEARGRRNGYHQQGVTGKTYLHCWTPVVNIMKDPRWGRSAESYGESPLLSLSYTSALLRALHDDDEQQIKIAPTLKHYTIYDGPEESRRAPHSHVSTAAAPPPLHSQPPALLSPAAADRFGFNADVTVRDLHDTFNYVYRHLMQERPSHIRGLMASYSALDGIPVACDFDLLTKQPRYDWGWYTGAIVSDCDAISGIFNDHHYTEDIVDAAALALVAGMDLNCGDGLSHVLEAVDRALISESDIDAALRHSMEVQFRLGFYDQWGDGPYDQIDPAVVDSEAHRKAVLDIAVQSMVLLQNNGSVLPIVPSDSLRRIAVIGPSANDTAEAQLCFTGGFGCLLSHTYHAYSYYLVQPLDGIAQWLSQHGHADVQLSYVRGCERSGDDESGLPAAVAAAKASDLVLYIGGLDYTLESEGMDRHSITLPAIQQKMLTALAATGVPVVSVMIHGSAISDDVLDSTSSAILSCGYPAQAAGLAIASLLFGETNPSGRLAYTNYRDLSQLPDIGNDHLAETPGRTHAFFSLVPRQYFGDGLSYTHYAYADASVRPDADHLIVSVMVSNVGKRDGSEVVQVYAAYDSAFTGLDASPALSVPRRLLVAFYKVFLRAGQNATVYLSFSASRLNAFGRWLPQNPYRDSDAVIYHSPQAARGPLTHEQVRAELSRMRQTRRELDDGNRPAFAALPTVTLPVWFSLGGCQPTAERIASGAVLVVMANVTAAIDDVPHALPGSAGAPRQTEMLTVSAAHIE